jgi:hypothetical protein
LTARYYLTDFMNLKINPTQFFRCAHMNMMCMYIFIEVDVHTYMSIYIFLIYDHQLIGMLVKTTVPSFNSCAHAMTLVVGY